MKRVFFTFFLMSALSLPSFVLSQDDESRSLENEPQETPQDEEKDDDAGLEPEDEDIEEKEETPEAPSEVTAEEKEEEEEEDIPEGAKTVSVDIVARVNYLFDNAPESFEIKYHIHFEGRAVADVAVIKGEAEITSEVVGYLAKWPTGACTLEITIPKMPFEMSFRKTDDENGRLNVRYKGKILESWKSNCTFSDAPGAKFDTMGTPEEWLNKALEKARPPLRSIALKLGEDEQQASSLVIQKFTFRDPPIGTAEIEGTGVVTVKSAEE